MGNSLPDRRQSRSRPTYVFRDRLPVHSRRFIGNGASRFTTRTSDAIVIDGSPLTLIDRITVS
jgi:hypothetical protein